MPLEVVFTCSLVNGLHARPASAIEQAAGQFASTVTLVNERTGQTADATSVLGVIALGIGCGDTCRLIVSGPDERAASDALARLIRDELPSSEETLPPARGVSARLPPMLADAGATTYAGTAVVGGIGSGQAVAAGGFALPSGIATSGADDPEREAGRLEAALDILARGADTSVSGPGRTVQSAVLAAQRAVARDPELRRRLRAAVLEGGRTAAGALADAEAHFSDLLARSESALVRERALDVRDVCLGALGRIYGLDVAAVPMAPDTDWVLIAGRLTPGQLLAVDRQRLRGLVLAHGGATSHTVILARSLGLPTLVGLTDVVPAALDGTHVVVDADLGVLVTDLTDAARRYYELEQTRETARRTWVRRFRAGPASTADGRRLEVGANVGAAADVAAAVEEGAEGVGVFRTETLFQGRAEPPTEDEQFEEYRRAAEAAGSRPVIIRTIDVGGDKPMPYLRLPAEENPFLGYRAIRLYPEFEQIVRTQLRALVRASAFGRVRVMLPMVTSIEEVRWVRRLVAEEQAAASALGLPHDAAMPIGAMVEVPAAALIIDRLCAHVDFFSIGTNDLLQYAMAADRANPHVASLYDPWHPGFIRLLRMIVGDARAGGRWVGLCGEMGGATEHLPLLVGLGLDEISVSVPRVGPIRAALAQLSAAECDRGVEAAAECETAAEAVAAFSAGVRSTAVPLVDDDLIALDVDARSKAEAIKIAVDRLAVTGRTDRPREVEDAVWTRESTYSTGFGHGFAIPHAKTDAVRSASLVMLRLREPVPWGSLDDTPVGTVLLLVMPESHASHQHLRILASLSRRLMHEEFRARLSAATDVEAARSELGESLGR